MPRNQCVAGAAQVRHTQTTPETAQSLAWEAENNHRSITYRVRSKRKRLAFGPVLLAGLLGRLGSFAGSLHSNNVRTRSLPVHGSTPRAPDLLPTCSRGRNFPSHDRIRYLAALATSGRPLASLRMGLTASFSESNAAAAKRCIRSPRTPSLQCLSSLLCPRRRRWRLCVWIESLQLSSACDFSCWRSLHARPRREAGTLPTSASVRHRQTHAGLLTA